MSLYIIIFALPTNLFLTLVLLVVLSDQLEIKPAASHLAAKHSECSNLPPLGLAEMSSMPIQCLDAIAGP
ncbi:hypothetical protein EDB85DRAFT_2165538 [Lactarius pseudohatsudake]|nr:hypothetical protein EDB85DRAFT_2165538 [Lactarius pseudohatsudake]